jgi:hypothetical protein
MLDVDDLASFGPETITIAQVLPGQYTYAVNHFSPDATLAGSGARVQVFSGSSLLQTFTVPTTGTGRWWTVFTLSGGTITLVNTIGTTPPLPTNCSIGGCR